MAGGVPLPTEERPFERLRARAGEWQELADACLMATDSTRLQRRKRYIGMVVAVPSADFRPNVDSLRH